MRLRAKHAHGSLCRGPARTGSERRGDGLAAATSAGTRSLSPFRCRTNLCEPGPVNADGPVAGLRHLGYAVRMIDGGNSLLTQNAPYVRSKLDVVVQRNRGVVILHPTEGGVEFRRNIAIDTEHVV